jgi:thiol-disulfide isomerase/thioredoxin
MNSLNARTLLAVIGFGAATTFLRGEVWHTIYRDTIEGNLTGVYGPVAVIATAGGGSTLLTIDKLDEPGVSRVADFLATRRAPVEWKNSTSKVAKALQGRLQMLREGKLVNFDPGARLEPDFYLVYFGAHWCPPCRAFSPRFVESYRRLKAAVPDRFEVIYISSDHDAAEQAQYARELSMPWPIVKYSALGRVAPLERWAGNGIPCLAVVTREGELLFHSYRGAEYLGPDEPLQNFVALLDKMDPANSQARRILHRVAVLQHVRAAGGGSSPAQPYVVDLDLRRYQTLEVAELSATLHLDADGKVLDAKFEPKLPTVIEYDLTRDAENWLFLPAVKDGHPQPQSVVLPLTLHARS